jgi:hypothetical protein
MAEEGARACTLAPEEFAAMWTRQEPLPRGVVLEGLCGRFIRGTRPEHFEMLSDEPGKRLSWVCSPGQLGALLGKSAADAMFAVGFRAEWLAARHADGTQHELVLFPAGTGSVATWANLWQLIREKVGEKVDNALEPFKDEIEALKTWPSDASGNGYAAFDPAGELQRLSDLPVHVKYAHEGFMTADRFLAANPRTLYHARGFLDHAIGCNPKFLGTGFSPTGEVETLVPNVPLRAVAGLCRIELDVTLAEIEALRRKEAQQVLAKSADSL